MPPAVPSRPWTLAWRLSWVAATAATASVVAVLTYPGGALIDTEAAQVGSVIGAVAGWFLAAAGRGKPRLNRVLLRLGLGCVAVGVAGAMWMFPAARTQRGEMYAGLGYAIGGVFAIALAVTGALWSVAGALGRRIPGPTLSCAR